MSLTLSLRYWRKHPVKLAVMLIILLSGIMALELTLLFVRSSKMQKLDSQLTLLGDYDVIAYDCDRETAEKIAALKDVTDSGMYDRIDMSISSNNVYAMAFCDEHSQEIFHMSMLRGRAPENENEFALDLTLAKSCGISPYPGQTVNVGINGNAKEFTLVGVFEIKSETAYGGFNRYPSSAEEGYKLPQIILDCSYYSKGSGQYTIFLQADNGNTEQIYSDILALGTNESLVDITNGRGFSYSYILGTEEFGETKSFEQTDKEISTSKAKKDIFSYIIPLFAVLIGIVTIISLYQMMKNTFEDRMSNSGLMLSIGMSKEARLLQLVIEIVVITTLTIPTGLLLARSIFLLTVRLTGIQNAFKADKLIKGVTYDPTLTTLLIISMSLIIVSLLYILRYRKMTALAFIHSKTSPSRRHLLSCKKCRLHSSFYIVFFNISYTTLSVALLLVIGMASMSFGIVFSKETGRFEASDTKYLLEESGMQSSDLSAQKLEDCMIEPNTENHHDYGISPQLFDNFNAACADEIKSAKACIVRSSGMMILNGVYDKLPYILKDNELTPKPIKDNNDSILSFDEAEGYAKLSMWEKAGYSADEKVYSAPFVALDEEGLSALELREGSIDSKAVSEGKECIIAVSETSYRDISALLHTGDEITLSTIMIDSNADELDANKLTNELYEKYGELAYSDTVTEDGTSVPITAYCIGKRKDIIVKIGGIAVIRSDSPEYFYFQSGRVNIFVSGNTFKAWGLPDSNYTSISAKLKDNADIKAVDKEWYKMLGECSGIKSSSKSELLEKYDRETNGMKNIFLNLEIMLILLIITGIILALISRLGQQRKNIAAMRAIGFTKRRLALISLVQNEMLVLLGAVVSLLPIYAFHKMSAYAQSLKLNGDEGFVTEETASRWTDIFLYNCALKYDMMNKIYRKDLLIVVMMYAIISGVASILPILLQRKLMITEELRKE